jgi:hypothetical protein
MWLEPSENTAFGTKKIVPSCQLQPPLKLLCLTLVWVGTNENTAFGTKDTFPSQHDVSTPKRP